MTEMGWIDAALTSARPAAVGALLRYFRDLDIAEEAFQEACLRALQHWPQQGPPRDPTAWLIFVGRNYTLDQVRRALETKEIRAVLFVMPLSDKYLSLVRGLFPQNAKTAPVLIPIESAGAIAEKERAYESLDIPKGTLRGSPPVPEDDVTTLQTAIYLVGKKSLDNDMIAGFTQALTTARRDLLAELPILAQFKAPDTDAGAYLRFMRARRSSTTAVRSRSWTSGATPSSWRRWRLARSSRWSRQPGGFSGPAN